MLRLDFITLFFHNRSAVDKNEAGLIDKWYEEVRRTGQPPKRTPTRSLLTTASSSTKAIDRSGQSTTSAPTAGTQDDNNNGNDLVIARSAKSSTAVNFWASFNVL